MRLHLKPTEIHQPIWREAESVLDQLMENPEDDKAWAKFDEANVDVVEENKARQLPEGMLETYTIDLKKIQKQCPNCCSFFMRLRKSHADVEARTKFDDLNEQLQDPDRLHQYLSDWTTGDGLESNR